MQMYERVCRLCLKDTNKLLNLQENIVKDSLTMLELLHQSVPGLQIAVEFPVPKVICESCSKQLLNTYKFQQMCMASMEKLFKVWQTCKKTESTKQQQPHPADEEEGKDDKEQQIQIAVVDMDCNDLDPIKLECITTNDNKLESVCEEVFATTNESGLNDLQQQVKVKVGQQIRFDYDNHNDNDNDDDEDDKPLICLRNRSSQEKDAHNLRNIMTVEGNISECKVNFEEIPLAFKDQCHNSSLSSSLCKVLNKKPYACRICQKEFSSTSLMQKHMRNKHKGMPLIDEDEKCQSPKSLQLITECSQPTHRSSQNNREDCCQVDNSDEVGNSDCSLSENVAVCGDDKYSLSSTKNSSIATARTTSDSFKRRYACNECNAAFSFVKQLERHRKKHTDAHRFVCLECYDRFKYPFMLQKHMEKHHPAESGAPPKVAEARDRTQEEKSYACKYCSAAYTNVGGLAQHMSKKHSEIVPFKCDKCDKTFVVEEHLKIHTNRHMGIKNFKCDQCDKSFSFKFAMKQHMRIHTGDLNYLCNLCGKKFYRPSNLRQHMQRHGDEKPYTCPQCPKRFKCPSDRYIHLMSHQEGKNHVCSTCGSRFSRVDTLHQHQILHTGEKPFKCDQCPMAFPRLMNLNRHLRTHTGEKPYKCKFCEKAYAQSNDLNKHLRTHVGENTYMCTQCPSAFKYLAELKSHEWEHYRKQKQEEGQCDKDEIEKDLIEAKAAHSDGE